MRYPNTRYGNPEELKYYSQGLPIKILAKKLKRSEKSVTAWINGYRKIPFWVPELMRLWHMERDITMRQMGMGDLKRQLGLVSGNIIEFKQPRREHNENNNRSLNLLDDDAASLLARENLQMHS